eukprot:363330-Chlamydomonas_euryale.AAC.14
MVQSSSSQLDYASCVDAVMLGAAGVGLAACLRGCSTVGLWKCMPSIQSIRSRLCRCVASCCGVSSSTQVCAFARRSRALAAHLADTSNTRQPAREA